MLIRLATKLPLLALIPTPAEDMVMSWPKKLPLLETPIAISSKVAPSISMSPLFLIVSKSMWFADRSVTDELPIELMAMYESLTTRLVACSVPSTRTPISAFSITTFCKLA